MSRKTALALVVLGFVVAMVLYPGSGSGQDDTPDRIAALETEVASQGNRISNLSGRVRELETAVAGGESAGSEKSGPVTITGSGDSKLTQRFGPGTYQASGDCDGPDFYVYVVNEANGTNAFAISVDGGGEGFPPVVIVEAADYTVEVFCDGDWTVSFE